MACAPSAVNESTTAPGERVRLVLGRAGESSARTVPFAEVPLVIVAEGAGTEVLLSAGTVVHPHASTSTARNKIPYTNFMHHSIGGRCKKPDRSVSGRGSAIKSFHARQTPSGARKFNSTRIRTEKWIMRVSFGYILSRVVTLISV
jgi:hypothetical protein